jgi:GntR family transcriptional regulator
MELIDREDHQKLYLQLYEIIKKKIESKEWPVGSQIPTEDELCKIFNVSRATVRTAILELVRQGYMKRQQGRGTFVYKSSISEGLTMLTNFKEVMLQEGLNLSMNILARTVMMPENDLEKKLNITRDKHIIYIKKLWAVDNEPVLLKEIYIPYNICPLLLEENLENKSIFDLFEKKYGIKITNVKNYIDIAYTNTNESKLLEMLEGSAVLLLNQYSYSGETLIMYVCSLKKPGKFHFFIEFERKAI